ncbi:hypothetical protein OG948_60525 (plasmid) [Embleya sp. NBC_00888]|uniref:hypothetical protein n=1 Tax=Embleya sp. NBC_00888 TaxID=2975960 RepID=UPI002F907CA8|nr:hypothetical protein OG948_60525 [Embleya sp. NBC_00888]
MTAKEISAAEDAFSMMELAIPVLGEIWKWIGRRGRNGIVPRLATHFDKHISPKPDLAFLLIMHCITSARIMRRSEEP